MHEYIYFNVKIKIAFYLGTGHKCRRHVNCYWKLKNLAYVYPLVLGLYVENQFITPCSEWQQNVFIFKKNE